MNFELKLLSKEHISQFKKDMQAAFQYGAVEGFGDIDVEILPESHIDRSLNTVGAFAFEAVVDGKMAGGAVVIIDEGTQHNHLDFLYVKNDVQNKGIGQKIWTAIESRFPDTIVWETATPYFERRNIHFYVNRCGFQIVEYFNKHHPDPDSESCEDLPDNDYFADFFRFEKKMK